MPLVFGIGIGAGHLSHILVASIEQSLLTVAGSRRLFPVVECYRQVVDIAWNRDERNPDAGATGVLSTVLALLEHLRSAITADNPAQSLARVRTGGRHLRNPCSLLGVTVADRDVG
jgi:hypothetical protein